MGNHHRISDGIHPGCPLDILGRFLQRREPTKQFACLCRRHGRCLGALQQYWKRAVRWTYDHTAGTEATILWAAYSGLGHQVRRRVQQRRTGSPPGSIQLRCVGSDHYQS